jgi:hypothetical protein
MSGEYTGSFLGASRGTFLEQSLGNESGRVSREEPVLKTQSWESCYKKSRESRREASLWERSWRSLRESEVRVPIPGSRGVQ